MPKFKAKTTVKKRISKITKSGRLLRNKMSVRHLVRHKSKRAKQNRMSKQPIKLADIKKIKQLLGI
ncbi:50S ribosomal protein L35 [Candidatus Berkelbacteria bacterium CG_4_8_14_3_um_filter_33_6]|uniref:50S ribosomal protein L35 n=1 Tax=Candidatus Berkelbacteria bacterium CG_4_10_14_0_2_um_filter_35_9_33_12 TaxID=1974499 RepID=A0A2M7W3K6_9BACT|nr:MAG: 50S ribosomal protein L35 [Candidatus Berkelbacteria bacterium CG23_combo_of_CG06-09_8_20_14_all_33_15]PIS08393.1 MAG: 50S ribosomal protein L35 [Candidatus Berkelbacteria bacterium CG10_big_fil_rev_8_21_14_0_10_33_10]PIX31121.1 MAG: 50S ribosomal protein L35 [Candidatus Berkelbacteria bacterium CG_4_8_14_3_um_filter_33_6]PJA20096.1 MAG: 50S ribosomal protein L35 [Candidatus Berkelbacteria bacterium CG_4_10_14_0_2_um_filter_35_9_33_12]PJB51351.1 MAG: 50S ribosomal protein L35 [Candidatu